MAVAKIIMFDVPSKKRKDDTFPICLKITHQRKRKYFSLGKHSLSNEWNKDAEQFRKNYKNSVRENKALTRIKTKANNIIDEFDKLDIPFSLETFEKKFLGKEKTYTLSSYFEQWIVKYIEEGKIGTASPYKTTINAIMEFCRLSQKYNGNRLKLTDISYNFLMDFEHWLKVHRGCKETTISVYMRTLRALLNKAIKEKVMSKDAYPFKTYEITKLNTNTIKRAIRKKDVKRIEALKFDDFTKEQFAQNIFLFSYYTRGMSFVDIAKLTKENLQDERITYIREKTKRKRGNNKVLSIKLLKKPLSIINFYIENKIHKGDYLFPIYDESVHITATQKYNRRKRVLKDVNKRLDKIAQTVGLTDIKLTTYVSRHTYATVLKKSGQNVSHISQALGHQDEKTTQIYLKSFENSELDEADENIL